MKGKIPILGVLILTMLKLPVDLMATNPSLIVEMKNGEEKSYLLEDNPVITFNSDGIKVTTKVNSSHLSFDEIEELTFGNSMSSTIDVEKEDFGVIRLSNDEVEITCASDLDRVDISVFTLSGQQFIPTITNVDNGYKLSLDNAESGVYILKIKNRTFKIIKK